MSPRRGSNSGPFAYKANALPLSYRGSKGVYNININVFILFYLIIIYAKFYT